jgi:septal ring factor EnvC (AmiA/AmiB activator)
MKGKIMRNALIGALALLCASSSIAFADQDPAVTDIRETAAAVSAPTKAAVKGVVQDARSRIKAIVGTGDRSSLTADQIASVKAIAASTRAQIKTLAGDSKMVKAQIRDIRNAIKARRALRGG